MICKGDIVRDQTGGVGVVVTTDIRGQRPMASVTYPLENAMEVLELQSELTRIGRITDESTLEIL